MPSFKTSVAIVAAAIFFSVRAQYTYQIDPNSVPLSTRQTWCNSQLASCPLLCLQLQGSSSTTLDNTCDPTTLNYDCTCGNGQAPSAANYSQTIPYFECTEYGTQCVAACPSSDSACQTACRVDHPCGAQDPVRVNSTTSSSMASTTAPSTASNNNAGSTTGSGAGPVFTGLGGGSTTQSSSGSSPSQGSKSSGAQAALDLARSYSLAIVFTGLFAGFALVM